MAYLAFVVAGLSIWLSAYATDISITLIQKLGGDASMVNAVRAATFAAMALAAIAGGLAVYVSMST